MLDPSAKPNERVEQRIVEALELIERFFSRIPSMSNEEPFSRVRVDQLHAIDHLVRLRKRLSPPPTVRRQLDDPAMRTPAGLLQTLLKGSAAGLRGEAAADWIARTERQVSELAAYRRNERPVILENTAGGAAAPAQALERLDTIRRLDRIGYQTWRICLHIGQEDAPSVKKTE